MNIRILLLKIESQPPSWWGGNEHWGKIKITRIYSGSITWRHSNRNMLGTLIDMSWNWAMYIIFSKFVNLYILALYNNTKSKITSIYLYYTLLIVSKLVSSQINEMLHKNRHSWFGLWCLTLVVWCSISSIQDDNKFTHNKAGVW
jgi:hypothetical protein